MERAPQHSCASVELGGVTEHALEQSLSSGFSAQVAAHFDCLAVCDPARSLTYGELDGWANGIAHAVVQRIGEGPEPVPLVFRQGVASTAGILGVLKAGRPYVSLDPGDPRAGQMVAGVDARIVVTAAEHVESASAAAHGRPVLSVDDLASADGPGVQSGPDSVAYVFFTSGSTGEPKGVYDSHRNVLHNVLRYTTTLGIRPTDRLTLIQSPSFSGCVSSLFSALLNGAALLAFPFDGDLGALARWVRDEHATIYHSVPAIYRGLLQSRDDTFPDVRIVRLEGDRAASTDIDLFRQGFSAGSALVNGLGTTETGLVRQLFVGRDTSLEPGILPIGYPVRDMSVVVTDETLRELPAGETGEIAVRSRYLALGYWNRPDLTAERFVGAGDGRTYRTGDLGRMREDGCLEYLGRLDGELKVLGNRVEPAEVEAELVRVPGVREAAVTTSPGRRGEGSLNAFVVPSAQPPPSPSKIRNVLRRRLPSYMVPSRIVVVDELPLGPTGKVDRRALTDAPRVGARATLATEDERLLARIWTSVLELDSIGRDDDFFDLGGDSLAAAEIAAQVESETGVSLEARSFLTAPTVASMAALLASPPPREHLAVLADGTGVPIVLCHGLYPGNTFLFESLARRMPGHPIWELEAPVEDGDRLESIVDRHLDALRRKRPTGPYVLAGHCSGGIVAREVAERLQASGENVELLVILGISPVDFPALVAPDALLRWKRGPGRMTVRRRIRSRVAHARTLPASRRLAHLAGGARVAVASLSRRPTRGALEDDPVAAPYAGRVALVLAAETTTPYTTDPQRDWRRLAQDDIDVLVLPGGDRDMMEEPLVDELAAHLLGLVPTASRGRAV